MLKLSVYGRCLIFLPLLFIAFVSSGQPKGVFNLHGVVTDSLSKMPLQYVSVTLYNASDTALADGTVTNEKGVFRLSGLQAGSYLVRVSFVGFQTFTQGIMLSQQSPQVEMAIMLQHTAQYLEALTIQGNRTEKVMMIDETRIRVGQNAATVTGNITDILKQQPGITIDAENTLYLRGNKNILILIDGRPTTLEMLNAIPASSIESIGIITNPDVKQDAEGTGGIIHIVMKQNTQQGVTGSFNLNYGFHHKFNGGANLQWGKKKWNLSVNYTGKNEINDVNSYLIRELKTDSISLAQRIFSQQHIPVHTASMFFQARPGSSHFVTAGLRLNFPGLHNSQSILGREIHNTDTLSYFRRNEFTFSRKNIEGNLGYKKVFEKNRHELNAEISFSRTKGSRPAEYFIGEVLSHRSEGGGAPSVAAVQLDYLKAYSKNGRIESGLKQYARWNTFRYSFFDLDTVSGNWIFNQSYSNDLEHREGISAGYAMVTDSLFKKIFVKAGMRVEYNTSSLLQRSTGDTIDHRYWFPFPFLMCKYQLSKNQLLSFSITRRVSRPTYPQLNPWINVIDQLTLETGNKNLEPETMDKFELNYGLSLKKIQFSTNLFFSNTRHYITQVSLLHPPDQLIVTYINADQQKKTGIDADLRWELNPGISINGSLSAFHTSTKGSYQEIDLATNQTAWSGSLKINFKPDEMTSLQISGNYHSPVSLPQFELDRIYFTDITIRKSFPDNQLIMNIAITDLFNTRKWVITSDNQIFSLININKATTRILWFGLTYQLKAYKPPVPKTTGNGEEDKSLIRIGQ